MAVFKGDYHLDRAIDASLSIRNKIDSLPTQLSFSPKVAIGINSGEAVSGNIGAISLRRLDYTLVGDMVNTAQRLQSVAGEGQIVISQAAYDKVKNSFDCRSLGDVKVKNKAAALALYEVIG